MAEKPSKAHKDDAEQSKRFVETAKQLESDKNSRPFDKALESIVKDKVNRRTSQ